MPCGMWCQSIREGSGFFDFSFASCTHTPCVHVFLIKSWLCLTRIHKKNWQKIAARKHRQTSKYWQIWGGGIKENQLTNLEPFPWIALAVLLTVADRFTFLSNHLISQGTPEIRGHPPVFRTRHRCSPAWWWDSQSIRTARASVYLTFTQACFWRWRWWEGSLCGGCPKRLDLSAGKKLCWALWILIYSKHSV